MIGYINLIFTYDVNVVDNSYSELAWYVFNCSVSDSTQTSRWISKGFKTNNIKKIYKYK